MYHEDPHTRPFLQGFRGSCFAGRSHTHPASQSPLRLLTSDAARHTLKLRTGLLLLVGDEKRDDRADEFERL